MGDFVVHLALRNKIAYDLSLFRRRLGFLAIFEAAAVTSVLEMIVTAATPKMSKGSKC